MADDGFDAFVGVRAVIDGGRPVVDAALHVDADAICPRCLSWIAPLDFVRRNGLDLLQHESCPRPLPPVSPDRAETVGYPHFDRAE